MAGMLWIAACLSPGGLAAQAVGPVATVAVPPGAVAIPPGVGIQAVVDAKPPGTTYYLLPGVHQLQQILPKDGDRFLGAPGAILNGARSVQGFVRAGAAFVADGQTVHPDSVRHGVCAPGFPRCDRPHALFLDATPLRAVDRLADLGPGRWYFDYEAGSIYLAEDPGSRRVELTFQPFAFGGRATGVTIQNLVVERYASGNQRGAINDQGQGTAWTILNNEVRDNYGIGIVLGSRSVARGNLIKGNGQLGVGSGGTEDVLLEANEIAFNVWNGVECGWECGGAKWGAVRALRISGNMVHHNAGPGLWSDERCQDVLVERNRVEDNLGAGIIHEISFAAIIRDNELARNGATTFRWGWSAQIQIQNSTDTIVSGNRIALHPTLGGNGITVLQQDRTAEFQPRNISIVENVIEHTGGFGTIAGIYADFAATTIYSSNIHFDRNRYRVLNSGTAKRLWSDNGPVDFPAWQASGQDRASLLVTQ